MKMYEIEYLKDIQTGETDSHTVPADEVKIEEGSLLLLAETGRTAGVFRSPEKKIVAVYSAGFWLSCHEFQDEAAGEAEWVTLEETIGEYRLGRDGAIGG